MNADDSEIMTQLVLLQECGVCALHAKLAPFNRTYF